MLFITKQNCCAVLCFIYVCDLTLNYSILLLIFRDAAPFLYITPEHLYHHCLLILFLPSGNRKPSSGNRKQRKGTTGVATSSTQAMGLHHTFPVLTSASSFSPPMSIAYGGDSFSLNYMNTFHVYTLILINISVLKNITEN